MDQSKTKHDAMKAYFEPKINELAGQFLFNFSDDMYDSISFVTNYSDRIVKQYIRVGANKQYDFTILINKAFSPGYDDLNLEAMNFAQAFMEWLEVQNKEKVFPDFGEKCEVKKIENLQNMPNLAGVDYENRVARYMLQCRVSYFEYL